MSTLACTNLIQQKFSLYLFRMQYIGSELELAFCHLNCKETQLVVLQCGWTSRFAPVCMFLAHADERWLHLEEVNTRWNPYMQPVNSLLIEVCMVCSKPLLPVINAASNLLAADRAVSCSTSCDKSLNSVGVLLKHLQNQYFQCKILMKWYRIPSERVQLAKYIKRMVQLTEIDHLYQICFGPRRILSS